MRVKLSAESGEAAETLGYKWVTNGALQGRSRPFASPTDSRDKLPDILDIHFQYFKSNSGCPEFS
jgi:hypothetical protein